MTYYKAIHPDGTDFYSGTVRWAPADEPAVPGSVVRHPWAKRVGREANEYLSASTVATDCTGMWWPCRLLEVEPVDEAGQVIEPVTPERHDLPNKRAAMRWRIVRELDPRLTLGPQAEQIVALMERVRRLTEEEAADLAVRYGWGGWWVSNAWSKSEDLKLEFGRSAAWRAVNGSMSKIVTIPVLDALMGLLVRDLIGTHGFSQAHYDAITGPWRRAIGPIHPDDKPIDMASQT